MADITDFLTEKGYVIENATVKPEGRIKYQYKCIINKKPNDEDIKELQIKINSMILKNNVKKGKELTLLIKKNEQIEDKNEVKPAVDINVDIITDMIFKKDLSYQELKGLLNTLQNSAYTKGFNAYKSVK